MSSQSTLAVLALATTLLTQYARIVAIVEFDGVETGAVRTDAGIQFQSCFVFRTKIIIIINFQNTMCLLRLQCNQRWCGSVPSVDRLAALVVSRQCCARPTTIALPRWLVSPNQGKFNTHNTKKKKKKKHITQCNSNHRMCGVPLAVDGAWIDARRQHLNFLLACSALSFGAAVALLRRFASLSDVMVISIAFR